ncbi:MAG: MFS transporter [Lactobacillaceae bacterium]|jgi:EmrB/QacA subfamily drug resistance transporter|nr:MFS transporter [Lactobacillaceae bacterium]
MTETRSPVSRQILMAIVATGILTFTGILTETSMNVTFPDLMQVFNISIGTVQWLTTAYLLTVSLVMTISPYLKTIFTPRNIFFIALAFFTVGDLIAVFSPNFALLLIGRIIQGIGTGVITPLVFNIILENVPLALIGQYMGFGTMILSLAPAFGPVFGGVVAYTIHWRAIFWLVLPVALISLILGFKSIPTTAPTPSAKAFDYSRFTLLAIAFTSFLFALNTLEHGTVGIVMLGSFAIAIIAFTLFIWRSKVSQKMFLNIGIIKNKALMFSLLAYSIFQFSNLAVNFMVPTYIQLVLGSTTMVAGLALMPGSLLGALLNPVYGRIFDQKGPKLPLLTGNTAFVLVLLGFAIIAQNMTVLMMTILYALLTLGRNLAFGNSMATGLSEIGPEDRPDGNAIYNTSQQFAGAIGTTVASLFMKVDPSSTVSTAKQTAIGSQHSLIFLVVLGLLNFVFFGQVFKNLHRVKS